MTAPYAGTSNQRLTDLINSDNSSSLVEGTDFTYGTPAVLTGNANYNTSVELVSKQEGKANTTVNYNRLGFDALKPISNTTVKTPRIGVSALVGKKVSDYLTELNAQLSTDLTLSEITDTDLLVGGTDPFVNVASNSAVVTLDPVADNLAWNAGAQSLWYVKDTVSGNVTYNGEVNNFITYADLCAQVSLPTDNLYQGSSKDIWFSLTNNGTNLFIPKHPILNSMSFNALYLKGLVYGTDDDGGFIPTDDSFTPVASTNQKVTVTINSKTYLVRCLSLLPAPVNDVPLYASSQNLDFTTYASSIATSEFATVFLPLINGIQLDAPTGVVQNASTPYKINYSGPLFTPYYPGELGLYGQGSLTSVGGIGEWGAAPILREAINIVATGNQKLPITYAYGSVTKNNGSFQVGIGCCWLPVLEELVP